MSETTIVLAVTSDEHVGSTLALCPERVPVGEGAHYEASRVQRWILEHWRRYWALVAEIRERESARLLWINNGDAVDGDHHQTSQIISRKPSVQRHAVEEVFAVPLELRPEKTWVIRGTEAHVGEAGSDEDDLARWMGAVPSPDGTAAWWGLKMTLPGGLRIDARHHRSGGHLPHTRGPGIVRVAHRIFDAAAVDLRPHPHVAFRGHLHKRGDSGDAYPTRLVALGSWQVHTGYVHKVAPDDIADIGAAILVARGTDYEVRHVYVRPADPYLEEESLTAPEPVFDGGMR